MSVRTKNLKAPLGFFLFADKIKKAGERLPIQRSPEIFRKPKKHPWFSSKNSVETSWSPLTPEHGFPSLHSSKAQGAPPQPAAEPPQRYKKTGGTRRGSSCKKS